MQFLFAGLWRTVHDRWRQRSVRLRMLRGFRLLWQRCEIDCIDCCVINSISYPKIPKQPTNQVIIASFSSPSYQARSAPSCSSSS